MPISVHAVIHYPVKGCSGTDIGAGQVGPMGLAHDRSFMVVDADGMAITQREFPSLAAIRPSVVDQGQCLRLDAPGSTALQVDVDRQGEPVPVGMFGRPVGTAIDQGQAAAEWFSEQLSTAARLVRIPDGFDRDGWGDTPGKVGFADAHAVSIASIASLDGLNDRIEAAGGDPVPIDRFRVNIVLAGIDRAHGEDRLRRLEIGSVLLAHSVRAMRCSVPLVDQVTGRRAGPEPVRTLATYRREPAYGNKVSFAVKAAVLQPGDLTVGDTVRPEWFTGSPPDPPRS